jgi:hypothetical protein
MLVKKEHLHQQSAIKYIPGCKLPVIQTEETNLLYLIIIVLRATGKISLLLLTVLPS